jgi:hypothetical protein
LESSLRGLQDWFRPRRDPKSGRGVMAVQSPPPQQSYSLKPSTNVAINLNLFRSDIYNVIGQLVVQKQSELIIYQSDDCVQKK